MAEETINIKGTVENVTYHNENNSYTVVEVISDDELITVVGEMSDLADGEQVEFEGNWTMHPSFGRQFRATRVKITLPSDASGILRYLSSGIIKGVRGQTAIKIVEKFGADSFSVIEKEPERLSEIKGISRSKAKQIQRDFKMKFASREVLNGLTALGLTQNEAFRAYNMFKDEAVDVIKENPYIFIDENGYNFDRAEEVATSLSETHDYSNYRSIAAVTHIVNHNVYNGHTCVPRSSVINLAKKLLDCNDDYGDIAIDNAIEARMLYSENIDGKEFLFMPDIYMAESSIADRIKIMTKYPPQQSEIFSSEILAFEASNNITFDAKQRKAIEIAVNKGLLILTGGPGTGKTTTVKGIISLMKNRGFSVALAAPTGRAAKRMSELCGDDAKTIHRLLEVEYKEGSSEPSFVYNLRNPLEYDAVIVDELSMVDVKLFASLLDALPLHCRLIMVGDKNQLPPVGAGNVLSDLMNSELIDVVILDKIFRQAMKSLIVTNAHRVVGGEMPIINKNDIDSDFFFLNEKSQYNLPKKVVDLVTRRIPATYNFDSLADIQVLCPSRRGGTGTENINALLQKTLNPPSKDKEEIRFKGYVLRVGDKVMQIKNNYDVPWFKNDDSGTGVFNGDIGILTRVDKACDVINVSFDDREAMYSFDNANQLELAYAMTVHKSQGSEFKAVIMPTIGASPKLCYRNLFYTALTRAKNLIILVGTENSIRAMVENDKKSRRYSALNYFLSVDNNGVIK